MIPRAQGGVVGEEGASHSQSRPSKEWSLFQAERKKKDAVACTLAMWRQRYGDAELKDAPPEVLQVISLSLSLSPSPSLSLSLSYFIYSFLSPKWLACVHIDSVCAANASAALSLVRSFSYVVPFYPEEVTRSYLMGVLQLIPSTRPIAVLQAIFPQSPDVKRSSLTEILTSTYVRDLKLLSLNDSGDLADHYKNVPTPYESAVFETSSTFSEFSPTTRYYLNDPSKCSNWYLMAAKTIVFRTAVTAALTQESFQRYLKGERGKGGKEKGLGSEERGRGEGEREGQEERGKEKEKGKERKKMRKMMKERRARERTRQRCRRWRRRSAQSSASHFP